MPRPQPRPADGPVPAPLNDRRATILDRRSSLDRRLEDGFVRIEQALAAGADVQAWEAFWLQLLDEYESVCDELADAA